MLVAAASRPVAGGAGGRWHRFALLASLAAVVLLAPAVRAQDNRSSIPAFTGERLYVGPGVPDAESFKPLADQLTALGNASPQSYYVVIVASTGTGQGATRSFTDRLYETWSRTAREKNLPFDPARSVIIVVATGSRQISVHPGSELQSELGLEGETIDRELVRRVFIPKARAGDYPGAISSLLQATEDWIGRRDPNSRQRRQQAEERLASLRQDAKESLDGANARLEEARKELEEKRASGLTVADLQATLDRAAAALPALSGRIESDPATVVRQAQDTRRSIEQVVSSLHERSAQQVQAALAIDALPRAIEATGQAIEKAKAARRPVSGPTRDLEAVRTELEAVRGLLATDPARALSEATSLQNRVAAVNRALESLPALTARRNELLRLVEPLELQVVADLDAASAAGADVEAIRQRVEEVRRGIETARLADPGDLSQAVATLDAAPAALRAAIDDVAAARSRRQYARILLLSLLGGILVAAGLIWALVQTLRNQARRSAEEKLKSFREQATVTMERLDALKERHKLLPVADTDFQQPMAGATLDLYKSVEDRLRSLWDRWLKQMEVLDQAQKLMARGSGAGVNAMKKVEEMLAAAGKFEEQQQQEAALLADLDRLNQAHEQAGAARDALAAQTAELEARLQTLAAAGIPVEPYGADRQAVGALLQQAGAVHVADPLGARTLVERAREQASALTRRVEEVHSRFEAAQELRKALDAHQEAVARHRAAGLRLDEPEGSPDPALAQAAQAFAASFEALKQGDPGAAAGQLDAAGQSLQEARDLVDRVLAARTRGDSGVSASEAATRRLRQSLEHAAAVQSELSRDFAPSSWQNVAHNLEAARQRIDHAEQSTRQVAELVARQHFLRASRLLDEIGSAHQDAEGLLKSLHETRDGLATVRDECRAGLDRVSGLEDEAARVFDQAGHAVGPAPRQALAAARQAARQTQAAASTTPPDWLAVRQWIARTEESYQIAHEQAEEELRYRDQVLARLQGLSQRADQLGGLLRSEQKDRPPANMRYRGAIQALSAIAGEVQSATPDWPGLSRRLDDVADDLDRVEKMTHEDIQLANQAIASIAEAGRMLRQAHAYSSMGVGVDLRGAESELENAQRSLQSQDYEQSIRLADFAENMARASYRAAEREAEDRQRRVEAERRRRDASETARRGDPLGGLGPIIAGAAASILINAAANAMSSGSRGRHFGGSDWGGDGGGGGGNSGGGGGDSGSSSSSWSSGTSESSW